MTEQQEPRDAAEIASEHLGRELLQGMVAELENCPKRYADMSEAEQHITIERLRAGVTNLVTQTMRILFAGDYPACPATLSSASVSGDIKARLTIQRTAISRHDLMDRVGQNVVVLMADPDAYLESMKEVRARRAQGDLFNAPRQGPDLSDVPDHDPELDLEPETPAPDPDEADEANWVMVANNNAVERNTATGSERVSTRELRLKLISFVTSNNQNANRHSVGFDTDEVMQAPRAEVLKGLVAIESYRDANTADEIEAIQWPSILRKPPRDPR